MENMQVYRRRLLKRLSELDVRLHGIETELDAHQSKDWEERAVEREDDEVLEGLGRSGQDEIIRIQAALRRLREGAFGFCTKCGNEVADKRLELLPDTPFCASCAASL